MIELPYENKWIVAAWTSINVEMLTGAGDFRETGHLVV